MWVGQLVSVCRIVRVVETAGWPQEHEVFSVLWVSPVQLLHKDDIRGRRSDVQGWLLIDQLAAGELMISDDALGDRFDLKSFHDTAFGGRLVSIPTPDRMVREWVVSMVPG